MNFNDMLKYERKYLELGYKLICGIDEAGRGPLAGPLSVCALVPDLNNLFCGVNDSKQLSDKTRRELYPLLTESAVAYSVKLVDSGIIDKTNILKATKDAMHGLVAELNAHIDFILVDAIPLRFSLPSLSIIHGDALSYSIAAASIVAKVTRDNVMIEYAKRYPEYGFEKNMGYGTKYHIEMIKKYGPTPIHRKSFLSKILPPSSFLDLPMT
jgi:ribonuclease HII